MPVAGQEQQLPVAGQEWRHSAPLPVVGALIGCEVGAATGLLFFGGTLLAPLGLAIGGALVGPVAAEGVVRVRRRLVERAIRQQLRRNHPAPGPSVAESPPAAR